MSGFPIGSDKGQIQKSPLRGDRASINIANIKSSSSLNFSFYFGLIVYELVLTKREFVLC